jgi:hypothetical protein
VRQESWRGPVGESRTRPSKPKQGVARKNFVPSQNRRSPVFFRQGATPASCQLLRSVSWSSNRGWLNSEVGPDWEQASECFGNREGANENPAWDAATRAVPSGTLIDHWQEEPAMRAPAAVLELRRTGFVNFTPKTVNLP